MNEDIVKSVARSSASLFGQQIATWGSSFLLMLFLPRYLGPVDYGRLYLAEMITGLFLIVIDYDGRYGVAKRIARDKEHTAQILSNSLGFRSIFWAISFISMIIFSFIADYPVPVKIMLVIMGIEMIWLGAKTVVTGTFLGHEVLHYSSIGAIVERGFIALFGIFALLLGANAIHIAIIMVLGTLINFFLCTRYARRIITQKLPPIDWKASKTLIVEGVPYLLWTIFAVIYYRIDTVMLSLLTPEQVVGWYAASYKFFDVLTFVPSIFSLSILPILSKLYGKENMMLARTSQKSQEFILIVGIPISIGVFTFADHIISFFFGLQGYGPSVMNLQIFSVGILLVYIDMVLGTAVIACDKQKQWAMTSFSAVFVNITLNYFMIPYTQTEYGNGGIGAAIATIITEFFVMVSAISILPKELFSPSSVIISLKAIAGGLLMGGFILVMRTFMPVHWIAQAVIAGFFYLGVLLALKAFNPAEIQFAKQFLSFGNLKGALFPPKGADV